MVHYHRMQANDIDQSSPDSSGMSPLLWGCYSGDAGIVETLIAHGANVNNESFLGNRPLLVSAKHGHLSVTRCLLHAKADVRAVDASGRTALMLAASRGHKDVVQLLLVYGADPTTADMSGLWSVDHARVCKHGLVFDLLLQTCINRTKQDESGLPSMAAPRKRTSYTAPDSTAVVEATYDDESWEANQMNLHCLLNREIVTDLFVRLDDFKQQQDNKTTAAPAPTSDHGCSRSSSLNHRGMRSRGNSLVGRRVSLG